MKIERNINKKFQVQINILYIAPIELANHSKLNDPAPILSKKEIKYHQAKKQKSIGIRRQRQI